MQEDNEKLSDCTRCFKAAREIPQSHLGGPILVAKAMEDTCPECVEMEDNEERGLDLLFGLDQATMIDKKPRSHACLENANQRKFGSVLKGLQVKRA